MLLLANWKMNHTRASGHRYVDELLEGLPVHPDIELGIAPPALHLSDLAGRLRDSGVGVYAQNCHEADSGAFTGEISAGMVRDVGGRGVLLGHSERRHGFAESDDWIRRKLEAVLAQDLRAVLCVGETLAERERGRTMEVVGRQLESALSGLGADGDIVVAYEPVWAIGTGRQATASQVAEVAGAIHGLLGSLVVAGTGPRLLYGGSASVETTAELIAVEGVAGLLVGTAALTAQGLLAMAAMAR